MPKACLQRNIHNGNELVIRITATKIVCESSVLNGEKVRYVSILFCFGGIDADITFFGLTGEDTTALAGQAEKKITTETQRS